MNWRKLCPNPPWISPETGIDADLLGVSATLEVPCLLRAYSEGVFPWYNEGEPVQWWSPNPRGIFNLERFYVSKRLARTIRSGKFVVTYDTAFRDVMLGCADREEGTWITDAMRTQYAKLHELGYAHSVETWQDNELVGGTYGVSINGLFAAESMFHYRTDASKVALAALVERLKNRGYLLLDTQMLTDHTRSLGAYEVPRNEYLRRLKLAIDAKYVTFT